MDNGFSSVDKIEAPLDFSLADFEATGGITIAFERCPLCSRGEKPFYCIKCLQNGRFTHSKRGDWYDERKKRWDILKRERQKLLERIQIRVAKSHEIDKKNSTCSHYKERLRLLHLCIEDNRQNLLKDQDRLRIQQDENICRSAMSAKKEDKTIRIKKYIKGVEKVTAERRQTCYDQWRNLATTRRKLIELLVEHIYPITADIQSTSSTDSMAMSTVNALKEASRTAYVKGRWVYSDNGADIPYRIVESTLPGNGNYSSYHIWVASIREDVSNADMTQRCPGHSIAAALSLSMQMTSILSHILDVYLPRKICYSEFCSTLLLEKQFSSAVSRLNHNVLYLGLSQGVNQDHLYPRNTLSNISRLLKATQLGRIIAFEVDDDLIQSIEEAGQSEESDDDQVMTEDDGDLELEWERVPHELPEMDIPTRSGHSSTAQSNRTEINTRSMTSESLMTSAVASMTSLWRAATGHFDQS